MFRRVILALAIIGLLTVATACEKTTPEPTTEGPLQLTTIQPGEAIPAEYGRLVSVTSSAGFRGWAQLWFEKPDSSIVTVFVNFQTGEVRDKILEIPRS